MMALLTVAPLLGLGLEGGLLFAAQLFHIALQLLCEAAKFFGATIESRELSWIVNCIPYPKASLLWRAEISPLMFAPNSDTGDWPSSKAGMLFAARWPQATRDSLIPSEAALPATRVSRNIS